MTKVSVQGDATCNIILPCFATHNYSPLPPAPPIPPPMLATPLSPQALAMEIPVPIYWPPGFALGQNKLTTTVFHRGMTIAQDGHDCGVAIVHVQMTPAVNNILTLMHIPFSSRKIAFSASKVTMNGNPTGCATMVAWPPTPMVYCAEPMSPPLASALSDCNSVIVGMTLGDWIFGALCIAADMILDWIFRDSTPELFDWKKLGESMLKKFLPPLDKDKWKEWGIKTAVGGLLGATRSLFTDQSSEVAVGLGNPYLKVGGKVEFGNGPFKGELSGRSTLSSGTVGTEGASAQFNSTDRSKKYEKKWGEPGTTTTETDMDFAGGQQEYQSTTTQTGPDGTTSVARSDAPSEILPPGTAL